MTKKDIQICNGKDLADETRTAQEYYYFKVIDQQLAPITHTESVQKHVVGRLNALRLVVNECFQTEGTLCDHGKLSKPKSVKIVIHETDNGLSVHSITYTNRPGIMYGVKIHVKDY